MVTHSYEQFKVAQLNLHKPTKVLLFTFTFDVYRLEFSKGSFTQEILSLTLNDYEIAFLGQFDYPIVFHDLAPNEFLINTPWVK